MSELKKIDYAKPLEHSAYQWPARFLADTFEASRCLRCKFGVEFTRTDGTKFSLLVDEFGKTMDGDEPCIRNVPPAPVTLELWANVYPEGNLELQRRGYLYASKEQAEMRSKDTTVIANAVPVEITYQPREAP